MIINSRSVMKVYLHILNLELAIMVHLASESF